MSGHFFVFTFYFKTVLESQKSWEDSTENSHISHCQFPLLFLFYTSMVHFSPPMSQCTTLLLIGVWHNGIFSSVSCSVLSNSLWPHGPQHARPSCPSPTCGVYPNSSPLSQWCHPTISFSVIPFSFCPQSFTASGSLPTSHSLPQVAKVLEF